MLASLEARYPGLAFAWPRPGVLEITFRGEKLNAMPPALHRGLARVWRDLEAVEGVRAVLLRGEGGVFSAGGSFGLIEEMRASHEALLRVFWEARDLVLVPLNFPRPVVAAVEKVAVGVVVAEAVGTTEVATEAEVEVETVMAGLAGLLVAMMGAAVSEPCVGSPMLSTGR